MKDETEKELISFYYVHRSINGDSESANRKESRFAAVSAASPLSPESFQAEAAL